MLGFINAHFEIIVMAVVAMFAVGVLRDSWDHLADFGFSLTLIAGGYLWVATYFPDELGWLPQLLDSNGTKVIAAFTIIVILMRRVALEWPTRLLKWAVILLSFISLYQLIVVGFMFNGDTPTVADLTVRFGASTDGYTTSLIFGGAAVVLLAIFLINRRVQVNRDESNHRSDHRSDHRNLDIRDHDIKNTTITQSIPQLALVRIKSQKAPIYLTPSQKTSKFARRGMEFQAIGRTMNSQMVRLINSQGRAFWTETVHVDFQSGNLMGVTPLDG